MKLFPAGVLFLLAGTAWSQEWEAGLSGDLRFPLVSQILAPTPNGVGIHNLHPAGVVRMFWSGWTAQAGLGFYPAFVGNFEDGYDTWDEGAGRTVRVRYSGKFEHPSTVDFTLSAGRSVVLGEGLRAGLSAGLAYFLRTEGLLRLTGAYSSSQWDGSSWIEVENGPLSAAVPVDPYLPLGFQVEASGDWTWEFLTFSLGGRWKITSLEELFRGYMPRQELSFGLSALYRLQNP